MNRAQMETAAKMIAPGVAVSVAGFPLAAAVHFEFPDGLKASTFFQTSAGAGLLANVLRFESHVVSVVDAWITGSLR